VGRIVIEHEPIDFSPLLANRHWASWADEPWLFAGLSDGYLPRANAFVKSNELGSVVGAIGDHRKDSKIAADDRRQHLEDWLLVWARCGWKCEWESVECRQNDLSANERFPRKPLAKRFTAFLHWQGRTLMVNPVHLMYRHRILRWAGRDCPPVRRTEKDQLLA
jgi:hypothetical protein